jgi:hypothetical protein
MFLAEVCFMKYGFVGKEYCTYQKFLLLGYLLSSCLFKCILGLFSCILCCKGSCKPNGTVTPVEIHSTCINHSISSSYHHRSVDNWRTVIARIVMIYRSNIGSITDQCLWNLWWINLRCGKCLCRSSNVFTLFQF